MTSGIVADGSLYVPSKKKTQPNVCGPDTSFGARGTNVEVSETFSIGVLSSVSDAA